MSQMARVFYIMWMDVYHLPGKQIGQDVKNLGQ